MKPKRVLHINLSSGKYETNLFPELVPYVGGVTMGVKLYSLYRQQDPIIFSNGPLNGLFPFASKTCVILENAGLIEDYYIGGSLSSRLRYSGLDALVITGAAKDKCILDVTNEQVVFTDSSHSPSSLGLPGRRCVLSFMSGTLLLDKYFEFPGPLVGKKFQEKRLNGLVITGTKSIEIAEINRYSAFFNTVLNQANLVKIGPGECPSCFACPLGCDKSKKGEMGGNILVHSLVACQLAGDIYSNLGTVFACLDVLGYLYTHEELESLPELFMKTLKEIQ